jgi:hypothetical protein
MKNTKLLGSAFLVVAFTMFSFALNVQAAAPTWDATGSYVINMEYLGTQYPHDMTLTQDGSGGLTGNGGSPVGANTYTWVITSGSVSANVIDFMANYTATPDAVTPQTVLHVTGTIANDGTINGTWSDNYQGGSRSGAISTVSGSANALGTLAAEDFGVVNYDTGLGILKGYTAGFGVASTTLAGATSVVVKLYSGNSESDLLQTNTAILSKFNADVTGTQFSSPFDVSGSFNYATDGYWTNVREAEYGQSEAATRVVARVTLANGKVVTATNTNLTGNPDDIFPPVNVAPVLADIPTPVTIPELSPFSFDANATDANSGDTLTYSLTGNPAGSSINSSTGVFTWTPSEAQGIGAYTFTVMVSDGTLSDSQSVTINVTEVADNEEHPNNKNECKNGGWKNFTSPSFKNQGQCVSYANHH